MEKEKILAEIAKNICNFWSIDPPYIKFYGWKTCFSLEDETINMDDDLLRYADMLTLSYAIIHETTHYLVYKHYQDRIIHPQILQHPHGTYFCHMLYTNIKVAGFNLDSYLKNAIEYPVVKGLLKKIDSEIKNLEKERKIKLKFVEKVKIKLLKIIEKENKKQRKTEGKQDKNYNFYYYSAFWLKRIKKNEKKTAS